MKHEHIPFEEPFRLFDEHLNIEGNHRILFSGKYGTGKTYFLNKFFEEKEEEYYKIHITPTNYVTTPTHDIMKLIKFDLFYHLMSREDLDITIDAQKLSWSLKVWKALNDEKGLQTELIAYAVSMAAVIGYGPAGVIARPFISGVGKLVGEILKKADEVKSEGEKESEAIKEFAKSITEDHSSPYENDIISELIARSIESIKLVNGKKVVLLIDDLDRVDPENIFRILNVFSAYNNYSNEENKFGVDKVIVVCDLDNIKAVYEHRFGVKADFGGYIDKFYTHRVYEYDNVANVEMFIYNVLLPDIDPGEKAVLSLLLAHLYKHKLISLRSITKKTIEGESYSNNRYHEKWTTLMDRKVVGRYFVSRSVAPVYDQRVDLIYHEQDFQIISAVKKLIVILGGHSHTVTVLKELKEVLLSCKSIDNLAFQVLSACLPYATVKNHGPLFFLEVYKENNRTPEFYIEHPLKYEFWGVNLLFQLKWNASSDRYNGETSVLEDCKVHLVDIQVKDVILNPDKLLDLVLDVLLSIDSSSNSFNKDIFSL